MHCLSHVACKHHSVTKLLGKNGRHGSMIAQFLRSLESVAHRDAKYIALFRVSLAKFIGVDD